ncbi:MAG: choice-of-anchor tandem repeat GloVer-containing protein [Terriglobales bacterium]|jgi:hypothetical protein
MKLTITLKSVINHIVLAALLGINAGASSFPQLQVLHSFVGGADGSAPVASLVLDAQGNLYGTTMNGGSNKTCIYGAQIGCGVVFELTAPSRPGRSWKETILYRFKGGADGAEPRAGLIFDQAGNLYGTTGEGGNLNVSQCSDGHTNVGCGVVFELSPQQGGGWEESVIYTFGGITDGATPLGNLIFDSLGNLFGTTNVGGGGSGCSSGSLIGCGTVFELTPIGSGGWNEQTLYQFQGNFTDAGLPFAGVVMDPSGNLYGSGVTGGDALNGAVFELIAPTEKDGTWTQQILYSFTSPGQPRAGVVFDITGNLYGATGQGDGTVFELMPSLDGWAEIQLYAFGQKTTAPWSSLLIDGAGNLYGAALGSACGAIYRLVDKGGSWSEAEYDFLDKNDEPCAPFASPIFGKWGALYGTSLEGGTCKSSSACGSVFGILNRS